MPRVHIVDNFLNIANKLTIFKTYDVTINDNYSFIKKKP